MNATSDNREELAVGDQVEFLLRATFRDEEPTYRWCPATVIWCEGRRIAVRHVDLLSGAEVRTMMLRHQVRRRQEKR